MARITSGPEYRQQARAAKQVQQSGLSIKIMTAGLLTITAYHCYNMHIEKKFPWQQGITLSDLKVLLPGSKMMKPPREKE